MRSSRLLALLLALQRAGSCTAAELAAELEVSIRTIYRDVAALQAAGVPIYTTSGSGGGIRLLERWRSPVDGMTTDEVRALAVGGGPAADLGLRPVLAVARSKLRSGLPESVRVELDRVAERFLVDHEAWFRPGTPPPALDVVADAVWSGTKLDIRYERDGGTVSRRLDPLGIVLKDHVWYLVARHRGQARTYRVSRIADARRLDEPVDRPSGFDLEQHWAASAAAFDRDIRRVEVELLLPASAVGRVRAAIPGELTRQALDAATTDVDGRQRVRIRVESLEVAFGQLAGVAGIEVVEPPELRDRLRRHGEELAARHR